MNEIVFILTCSFSLHAVTTNSQGRPTTADRFSKLCPYTAQCHKNATKHLPDDYPVKPCCTSCSCHNDCLAMGNCCPDKRKSVSVEVNFSCKKTLVKRENNDEMFYRGHNHGIKRYLIIDNCPKDVVNTETNKLCTGRKDKNATLEDYIWVSDLDSGRIFQNEFCARCHGVSNIIQWQVVTTCFDILLANISTALTTVLSDLCSISVVVPEIIAAMSKMYRCYLPQYSRCNETGLWDKYDEELEQACLEYASTYFDSTSLDFDLYKNVFCYVCNHRHETDTRDICLSSDDDFKFEPTEFSVLLNFNRFTKPMAAEYECGIAEIRDKRTKLCRELFCPFPTTPFYGICIKLSKNVFGLAVTIYFKLIVLGNRTGSKVNTTTAEIGQAVYNAFSKSIGLKRAKCPICHMIVMGQFESVATPEQFYILATVYTTSHCQYDRITELVSAVLAKEIKITMPDKSALSVRVSIDKRTYSETQSAAEVMYVGGTITCGRVAAEYQVKNGLFCPQIEINRSEMSSFIERSGQSQRSLFDEGKIADASNGSIRICEEEYFATTAQTNNAFRLFHIGGGAIGCCLLFSFVL